MRRLSACMFLCLASAAWACGPKAPPTRVVLLSSGTQVGLSSSPIEPDTTWLFSRKHWDDVVGSPTQGTWLKEPMWNWPADLEPMRVLERVDGRLLVEPLFESAPRGIAQAADGAPCGARIGDPLRLRLWVEESEVLEVLPLAQQGAGEVLLSDACASAISKAEGKAFSTAVLAHDQSLRRRIVRRHGNQTILLKAQWDARHRAKVRPKKGPKKGLKIPRTRNRGTVQPNATLTWRDGSPAGNVGPNGAEIGYYGSSLADERVCFEDELGEIDGTYFEVCVRRSEVLTMPKTLQ